MSSNFIFQPPILPEFEESIKEILINRKGSRIFKSNRINVLALFLKKQIDLPSNGRRVILVPSLDWRDWLLELLGPLSFVDWQLFYFEETLPLQAECNRMNLQATEIHLFHPPQLTLEFARLLEESSLSRSIHLYLLVPSPLFLTDLIPSSLVSPLDPSTELLSTLHFFRLPLLKRFEEHPFSMEQFVPPSGPSFLQKLQRQFFFLEMEKNPLDSSLQFISGITQAAEVAFCAQKVAKLFENDRNLQSRDIALFAVNLSQYAPYLEALLLPLFPLKIERHKKSNLPEELVPIGRLFRLFKSKWSLHDVLLLFGSEEINEWLQKGGLSFGYNRDHKETILGQTGVGEEGTLLWGIQHLLLRASSCSDEEKPPIRVIPPLVELLNRLELVYKKAQEFSQMFVPFLDWFAKIKELISILFPELDPSSFYQTMQSYSSLTEPLSFDQFLSYVEEALESVKEELLPNDPDFISCKEFALGSILPKRINIVLGLDLETFPRKKSEDAYLLLELLLLTEETLILSHSGRYASFLIEELKSYALLE